MPANEYFKAAANALRQAGEEKKREASELRRAIEQKEVDIKHQVQDLQTKMTAKEVDMAPPQDHQQEMDKLRDVNRLQKILHRKQADLTDERRVILQRVKELEAEANAINMQASQLETRM